MEFVNKLAKSQGFGQKWLEHKGHIIYDLEKGKLVLIELLENAGVESLYDTYATGVVMDDNVLKGVFIESKSGREAILAKRVIDATGDSDIANLANVPLNKVNEETGVKHSFVFRIGNVDVDRFVKYFADNPSQYPSGMDIDWDIREAYRHYEQTGSFLFPHGGGMQMDIIKTSKAKRGLQNRTRCL